MQQFYTMVNVQATLFIYMAVGYGCSKRGLISKGLRSGLTDIVIYILLPCMIFDSFNRDMTAQQLFEGAVILGASIAVSFCAWIIGSVIWRRYPAEKQKILNYATLVNNCSFAGMPVIQGVYGVEGLFLAALFIVPIRILMWTAGISMFHRDAKGAWVKNVLLNPGVLAVFVGLARMLTGIALPGFCNEAIADMGNATGPLSLIIVGSILADVKLGGIVSIDTLLLGGVRLFLLPGVAVVITRLMGLSDMAVGVAMILTAMPAGATTAILAEKYGADSLFGSRCIFVTTVMSLFTVPLLMLLI